MADETLIPGEVPVFTPAVKKALETARAEWESQGMSEKEIRKRLDLLVRQMMGGAEMTTSSQLTPKEQAEVSAQIASEGL